MFVIIVGGIISSYAYEYRFEHRSDKIDIFENSVTYTYVDHDDDETYDKTYTISNDWLSSICIRTQYLDYEGDGANETNTTIYGPYVWLPAGEYKITFDFTDDGGSAFEYWDIGVNFGAGNTGPQKYDSNDEPIIANG